MKIKIFIIFCQYLLFNYTCHVAESKAVLGSNVRPTSEYEYPYLAFISSPPLVTSMSSYVFCMGVLITEQDVLTTENCLIDKYPDNIIVNIGSYDIRQTSEYGVIWWVNYDSWLMHRQRANPRPGQSLLTIIRLNRNVTDVPPAILSYINKQTLYGKNVTIASWGKGNNGRIPMIMQAADVTVITKEDCEQRFNQLTRVHTCIYEDIFCTAATPYVVVAEGDYGSPLIYENAVVGITKHAAPLFGRTFNPRQFNVHYTLEFFRQFIIDIVLCT